MKTNRKTQQRFDTLFQNRYFPFAVLFLLTFILHLVMNMYSSDDYIMRSLTYDSLFSFMVERYLTWSTRIFTDTIFMVLLRLPTIIWRVLDTAVYTLFAMALSYLISGGKNRRINWLMVLLFLLYPFTDMVSAGWIVTTCVYLWSAAAIAFSLVPLRMPLVSEEKRLPVRWMVLGVLSSFLAGSQEQACCTLIALTALIGGYAIYHKKFHPLMAVQFGIGLLMLGVHLLSPALPIRDVAEAAGWFPDFSSVPFLNRLEMGFSSTMFHFIMEPNWIFLAFCILLFCRLLQKKKHPFIVFTAGFPLFLSLVFGFSLGFDSFRAAFPQIASIRDAMTQYGTNPVFGDWDSFLPLVLLIATAVCLIVALYHSFSTPEDRWLSIYALLVGTAVRMVLGFSPTIWGSGNRTFIILYFVFVYLSGCLAREMERENRPYLKHALPVISFFALCQFVTTLLDTNAIGQ